MAYKKVYSIEEMEGIVEIYKRSSDNISSALKECMGREEELKKQLKDKRIDFEKECRRLSLQIARDMKPSPSYWTPLYEHQKLSPIYDLIGEAEKIYQWLVKSE